MSIGLLLLIFLIVLLAGSYPGFGFNRWGYAPMGGLGVILVIVVVLILLGRF